jgi:hypothetical protein
MGTIIKSLEALDTKDSIIKKGEISNQLLLAESNETKRLKQDLGWAEDILESEKVISDGIEMKNVVEKYGKNIFTEETLKLFCIDNHYGYCLLRDYKGPTNTVFMEALDKVIKANNFTTDYAKNNLYILAPLSYFKTKSSKITKVRKSKHIKEIIVLEQINEQHKGYNKLYYKELLNIGKKDSFTDKFKSLFLTHPSALNHIINTLVFIVIALLIYIFIELVTKGTASIYMGMYLYKYLFLYLPLIILTFKLFLKAEYYYECSSTLSFNVDNYKTLRNQSSNEYTLLGYFNSWKITDKIYNRILIRYIITAVLCFVFYYGVVNTFKCSLINSGFKDLKANQYKVLVSGAENNPYDDRLYEQVSKKSFYKYEKETYRWVAKTKTFIKEK